MSKKKTTVYTSARTETCCICGAELPVYIDGKGNELRLGLNNPYPLNNDEDAICCDSCDVLVTAARLIPKCGGDAIEAMKTALEFHEAKPKAREVVVSHVR